MPFESLKVGMKSTRAEIPLWNLLISDTRVGTIQMISMSSAPRNDTAINMNMYFESLYIYINVCTNKSINIYNIYIYLHYTHYILNMYTFARHVCKKKKVYIC